MYEQDGKLFARIEKLFAPGDDAHACTKCTDERKGQPLIGLVFMRNMNMSMVSTGTETFWTPTTVRYTGASYSWSRAEAR